VKVTVVWVNGRWRAYGLPDRSHFSAGVGMICDAVEADFVASEGKVMKWSVRSGKLVAADSDPVAEKLSKS
jgi:hypothetical protein